MNAIDLYFGKKIWLILLIPAILLPVFSYRRMRKNGMSAIRWTGPMALRMLACVAAVCIAADFSALTNMARVYTLVLADGSDSMCLASEQMWEDVDALTEREEGEVWIFAGRRARLERAMTGQCSGKPAPEDWLPWVTDLGAALQEAGQRFPYNRRRRIVILSDGMQTDGDALKQAAALAGQGTRIDAIRNPLWTMRGDVEAVSLDMPAEIALGQSAKATLVIRSSLETAVQMSLFDDEELIYTTKLNVEEGALSHTINVVPSRSGMHVFRAVLEPQEDGFAENNEAACCVNVEASRRILLIDGTGRESAGLCALLKNSGYDVDVKGAKEAPPNISGMCKYGMVILMNADVMTLPVSMGNVLNEYISKYGRSVLITGGENTYAYGHMHETLFDDFLPVQVKVEEEESAEPVAIFLLIDNSASMAETPTNLASDQGRPIEMAKLGAIKSINLLHANDYAGVISFSMQAHLLSKLKPMTDKEAIIATVSRMGTISGTMYTEALKEAMLEFASFEEKTKRHIIFLSDGNPMDDDYMPVVEQLAQMGVTISTISVGAYANNDILKGMAEAANGRFIQVQSISELPNIMASDTILQQVDYTVNRRVMPVRNAASPMLAGLTLPELEGYIRVEAKDEADSILTTEEGYPLYVQWNHGAGMAACFMSDMNGTWSERWLAAGEGREAILEIVSTLLPEEQEYAVIHVELESGGREGILRVFFDDAQGKHSFEAEITSPTQETQNIRLLQTQQGIYERSVALEDLGRYDLVLREYDEKNALCETYETACVVTCSTEYEAFHSEEEQQLLENVCALTGGQVYGTVEELLSASLDDVMVDYDLSGLLSVAMVLAFMAEQLLRHKPMGKDMTKRSASS